MKIGIIGAGAVGAACAMATIMRGCASELVLVNRNRDRAKGMATDMGYGAPLSTTTRVTDGDYSDLAGAALVMITAGVNEKSGGATDRKDPQGRLRLLDKNAEVYREVIPRINAAAPEAVLLVVTDPPDPLAFLTRELAGHDRVLSTGTLLDSLRFRVASGSKTERWLPRLSKRRSRRTRNFPDLSPVRCPRGRRPDPGRACAQCGLRATTISTRRSRMKSVTQISRSSKALAPANMDWDGLR